MTGHPILSIGIIDGPQLTQPNSQTGNVNTLSPNNQAGYETSQSSSQPGYETTSSSNRCVGITDGLQLTRPNSQAGNVITSSPSQKGNILVSCNYLVCSYMYGYSC